METNPSQESDRDEVKSKRKREVLKEASKRFGCRIKKLLP